ncbi:MAG: hypothetical protein KH135_02780 [Firmicutes bacterium]|nr:hypothetical protein [Bacillota bacterium]
MNVIIANKYQSMLQSLNIDIIKTMYGEFEVEEIIKTFKNFFFQRMVLDITAIKDYKDISKLQKLSVELDMSKIILFVDDTADATIPNFYSMLVAMGIYNFTKSLDGVQYLLNTPNTYKDVAHYLIINPQAQMANATINSPSSSGQVSKQNVSVSGAMPVKSTKILGIKNVTKNTGATTLVYMMLKQLEKNYKVAAFEIGKREFSFFRYQNMYSVDSGDLQNRLSRFSDYDVVLIDVNNDKKAIDACTDVIYLIEPSIIKLNRLTMVDPKILTRLKNKKVILNQSLLSSNDVAEFEYESKLNIFFNLPPLDERESDLPALNDLLAKLGFTLQADGRNLERRNKILGIF